MNLAISIFVKSLENGFWQKVLDTVTEASKMDDKTGAEKRDFVAGKFEYAGVASWLVNLALEVAVAKSRM